METSFLIIYQCVKRRKTKVKQHISDTAVLQVTIGRLRIGIISAVAVDKHDAIMEFIN